MSHSHGAPSRKSRQQSQSPGNDPLLNNVRVVCRLRPMDDREKRVGTVPAASASSERREVAVVRSPAGVAARQARALFRFDHVLGSFSTQADVFAVTLQPLVEQVLAGYEATAFAYGQTGTGKTYTMEGSTDSEEARGLMPRAATAVLDALAERESYADYSVTVSYLEVYNEELSDLLAPRSSDTKLELKESDNGRGVKCHGLLEMPVSSVSDILDLVRRAQDKRRVAETRINARSSRSHCIFTMRVRCRRKVRLGELENCGKLHLVDLAGSECAKKASSEDPVLSTLRSGSQSASEQERERRNINQSLLTLGRVIASLRDKSSRVPYRDSKLTRLLKDALGGSCKTVLIATISPALTAAEESILTLTYAEQASGIQNRPAATSLLKTMRFTSNGENPGHGRASIDGGSSATDWGEMEMRVLYLTQELEEAQAALARTANDTQEHLDRAVAAEAAVERLEAELAASRAFSAESERLRLGLAATTSAVASGLASAAEGAQATADLVAAEISELREQRRAEETLVGLLAVQRAELQNDVMGVQASLGVARDELAAMRVEMAVLVEGQAAERQRALDAIVATATAELGRLVSHVEAGGSATRSRLDRAEAVVADASAATSAAEVRSAARNEAVESEAAAWCQEVWGTCDALAQHCATAIGEVRQPVATAASNLAFLSGGPAGRALAPLPVHPIEDANSPCGAKGEFTAGAVAPVKVAVACEASCGAPLEALCDGGFREALCDGLSIGKPAEARTEPEAPQAPRAANLARPAEDRAEARPEARPEERPEARAVQPAQGRRSPASRVRAGVRSPGRPHAPRLLRNGA